MTLNLWLAFIAAFVGANLNATVGGGTFLTYPVLLLLGSTGVVANATSTVVLWPGIMASLPGFKKEIKKSKRWVKALIFPALAGAILGSFTLTHTPNSLFVWVAPFLIIIGSLLFQFQAPINRFFHRIKLDKPAHRAVFVFCVVFIISLYGAYFGAGIGILLLGALSILGIKDLYQNIALKNILAAMINFIAALYFILSGIVHWQVVPLMATGAILGGISGSHLVRHVDQSTLRRFVVILGYGIAITLLVLHFI